MNTWYSIARLVLATDMTFEEVVANSDAEDAFEGEWLQEYLDHPDFQRVAVQMNTASRQGGLDVPGGARKASFIDIAPATETDTAQEVVVTKQEEEKNE